MKIKDDGLLATMWRFLQLTLHHYENSRTGEVFLVLTLVILDRVGRNATVSELASITEIPLKTVSRYVSNQIKNGHLMEKINPQNRSRRELYPTETGKNELAWLTQQIG